MADSRKAKKLKYNKKDRSKLHQRLCFDVVGEEDLIHLFRSKIDRVKCIMSGGRTGKPISNNN